MARLLIPVEFTASASLPMARLLLARLVPREPRPMARLLHPVILPYNALWPMAKLPLPIVLLRRAV
jgi:hypothetical protein